MPDLGSTAGVRTYLQATEGDAFQPADLARMDASLRMVSSVLEEKTGAAFYLDPADVEPTVKVVEGVPVGTTLYLPLGLSSVAGIVANPLTWNGTAWSNGTTLTASQYRLAGLSRSGVYRTLLGVDYAWGGRYVITGVWEDQVAGVPDDLNDLANWLAAEFYKEQKASPAGFTGPDGATVPIRDVWKTDKVKTLIDKYRVGPGMWF